MKETAVSPGTSEGARAPDARRECVRVAKNLYRLRRVRARAFGADAAIFGEPAWDILLNLYIAQCSGRQISVRRAALSGEIPQTTGLRILGQLEERGLTFRVKDDRDKRRSFVRLSEAAVEFMEACLPTIVDRTGADHRPVKRGEHNRSVPPNDTAPAVETERGRLRSSDTGGALKCR